MAPTAMTQVCGVIGRSKRAVAAASCCSVDELLDPRLRTSSVHKRAAAAAMAGLHDKKEGVLEGEHKTAAVKMMCKKYPLLLHTVMPVWGTSTVSDTVLQSEDVTHSCGAHPFDNAHSCAPCPSL